MTAGLPMPHAHDVNAGKAGDLGRALRIWRAARRIKQTHLAAMLRVSQATLSRWENGTSLPGEDGQARIAKLLEAGFDSAADFALGRLVRGAAAPMHLVCDFSHKLLAASPARVRSFSAPLEDLIGASLWPFASAEIVAAEARLSGHGWFEPAPRPFVGVTGGNGGGPVRISPGRFSWTRLRLSDGGFVRLVETL